jgi:hypothetical protein
MATINWEQAGKDSKSAGHNDAQSAAYAKSLNGGVQLSTNQQASFSKGYIGAGLGASSNTNSNTNTNTTSSGGSTVPQSILEMVRKGLQSQGATQDGTRQYGSGSENANIESSLNLLFDANNKLKSFGQIITDVTAKAGEGMLDYFQQQNSLLQDINEKTMMTGKLSEAFRQEITDAYPDAQRLGISFQDMSKSVENLVTSSGRFRLVSTTTIGDMALASKFVEGGMAGLSNMADGFENVSMGVSDMTKVVTDASTKSLTLGLNGKQTVTGIANNIEKLNSYGFKGGVEGLAKMVRQSQEFKINMSAAFGVADEVMDPARAMDMAAQLQALGGAIGDFNDPLKLMYMATNDVGGLQDAIIGASKGLATYNQEQGRFEITGANLRQAKAMAKELGMSYEEFSKTAINAAQRASAFSDIASSGLVMKDEDREFLTNMSTMKGGKMVIEVPKSLQEQLEGKKEIELEKLTEGQKKLLIDQREAFAEMSPLDIAKQQVSLTENINREISFVAAAARVQLGENAKNVISKIGFDPLQVSKDAAGMADKVKASVVGAGGVMKDVVDSLFQKEEKQKGKISAQANSVDTKTQEAENAKKNQPTTENKGTKSQLEVKFVTNEAILDTIKREMFKDSTYADKIARGYTTP